MEPRQWQDGTGRDISHGCARQSAEAPQQVGVSPVAGAGTHLVGGAVALAILREVWQRMREKNLEGEIALVTGAGSGIYKYRINSTTAVKHNLSHWPQIRLEPSKFVP